MRSSKFALIAGLMLFPIAAQAKPKWHTIFKTKNVSVAMDTAGVTRSASDFYTVWTRWDYSASKPLENKKTYSRLMEKVQIKCNPTRVKRVSTSLYNKAGAVVKEEDSATSEELEAMTWDPPRGAPMVRACSPRCARSWAPSRPNRRNQRPRKRRPRP
jgi:hypothetical protein